MSPPIAFAVAIITLLPLLTPVAAAAGDLHALLTASGLPPGLFPNEISSFSHDAATGELEVRLARPCYAKYDGLAYFDQVVRGNLSFGELRGLEGMEQEELFLWLPVKGVVVTDQSAGVILIDIGFANKRVPISLFEVPPECRPEVGALRSAVGGGPRGRKFGAQEQRWSW